MGKRSDFKRIERDNYATPAAACAPLLPWLPPRTRFIEPCAGEGVLAGHLKRAVHILVGASDLPTDARVARYEIPTDAIFCTNPPFWGQPANLHPLIINLSDHAPTWLLMSADWLHNRSSAPLMPRLRMIVSIGRVKWIANSPFTGKDNCIWAMFERPSAWATTRFVGRNLGPNREGTN
jgi:hypothetical protein